jgi:C-methyltransferase
MTGVALNIASAIPKDAAPTPADAEHLAELITSSWVSHAINAGIELGVFDALVEQPSDLQGLSQRLGCAPTTLKQLLNACGSLQLCRLDEHGHYMASAMGRMLAPQTPGSQQAWALLWSRELAALWSGLTDSVRRGASVRSLRGNASGFDRLRDDPIRAEAFNRAMTANTWWVAQSLARCPIFDGCRHVVDVGGGHGVLVIALLAQHGALRGTVYDLPHAAVGAKAALEAAELADRATFVSGDFFASVPAGGDAYLLKSVLHDWPDPQCAKILACVRAAMEEETRLLLVERLANLR